MKTRIALLSLAALAVANLPAHAAGSFELLALPHSFMPGAVYVSADGSALCGWNNFYWTAETGYRFAADGGFANISGDGSKVAGTALDADGNEVAAIWTPDGGWTALDAVPGGEACGTSISSGYALNADGSVAVGLNWIPSCRAEAFKWVEGAGSEGLGHSDGASSRATDLSDDGTTTVGFDESPQYGFRRAAFWKDGLEGPQLIAGDAPGEAMGVSSDGSRICGQANGTAFYYSESTGLIDIGALPDEPWGSTATGVSDNGTVVGWSGDPWFSFPSAIIWTQEGGIQQLSTYLTAMSVDVAGCYLYTATSISADGHTIAGTAIDQSGMWFVPYVVHLPGTNPGVASDVPSSPRFELGVSLYPNPSAGATNVALSLQRPALLRVSVIDASGRQIKRLADASYAAGSHPLRWDGTDATGRPVSSGAYFIRVEGPGGIRSEKLSLIR